MSSNPSPFSAGPGTGYCGVHGNLLKQKSETEKMMMKTHFQVGKFKHA
jgi:hypothetical protein